MVAIAKISYVGNCPCTFLGEKLYHSKIELIIFNYLSLRNGHFRSAARLDGYPVGLPVSPLHAVFHDAFDSGRVHVGVTPNTMIGQIPASACNSRRQRRTARSTRKSHVDIKSHLNCSVKLSLAIECSPSYGDQFM